MADEKQRHVRRATSWSTSDFRWFGDDRPGKDSIQISEPEAVRTGLLNADGNPLYRQPSPVGFIRFKAR